MVKIKRALISVSDKAGIVDFALELHTLGVEILSTGGTAKALREAKIPVIEVSDYTGFPEMLDGRVKTLHPKIHGGLLALRDNPKHMESLKEHKIGLIDMVVVNLYPFEKTTQKPGVSIEEVIENIDIGGPSMLRSAAKNHRSVAVVCTTSRYSSIVTELKENKGSLSEKTLQELGIEVFKETSHYDAAIHRYLKAHILEKDSTTHGFPHCVGLNFVKIQDLRYGENPHQKAAFYRDGNETKGLAAMKQLWGKELSFNNILDLNAAVNIVKEFSLPAAVFIKHNNPCGVAENDDVLKAYRQAWACDKLSAFGGIVAVNREIDLSLSKLIAKSGFLECVVSPRFSLEALSVLKEKKNVRLLELPSLRENLLQLDFKRISGGLLVQDEDALTLDEKNLKVVTKQKPTAKEMESLIFAWKVAKHTKSNAIILAKGKKTVGIGAGQMSRVDSVFIATRKADIHTAGSVLASDAFFPKEDAVQLAAKYRIAAIIQPGGSIADEQIIKTADQHKISMVFTGLRHFKH
ncbi:MAG: bifunctional phosphoribosylaminoimidazolecarboxamide formyltransferase/IMP cyclohydrolase [Omnitrophica WOR_2 bacterium GWF2_43_52]|nr:MAG: bifunctional phosphoribosylaminoimidazolecarboxamide formyltransferase/IMP cyclohydrolase [Omnitrophica WOR_2 bacterium GWC2_44_8]OGX21588.1 MAG: bifunctional phosphoribosylaminoimidazolecarboxamide formyltransferase/IMP cyclohydrolase [Omnitrophica WOR_2 bacterium GWF2_43_52]OGX59131.1 MAG: bifunctional phosphoribosylaminoimidazolecarboxamide formyltransferase/IMP cyclohydrolase [Omnitrophica WOR_2 bacterium RIFOXYC2_FULL_43_9]HAH19475.1 bifunctional phosphoribosylaminoimidazolecarboxam